MDLPELVKQGAGGTGINALPAGEGPAGTSREDQAERKVAMVTLAKKATRKRKGKILEVLLSVFAVMVCVPFR